MKSIQFLFLTIVLVGCVTHYRYEPPSSGPTATLTVKTLAAKRFVNNAVVSYSNDEYLESKGDVVTILRSSVKRYEYADQATFKVRANEEFRFSTKIAEDTSTERVGLSEYVNVSICQTHTSFVPEEGKAYLAEHRSLPNGCEVLVYRVNSDGSRKLESSAKKLKSCLDPALTSFKQGRCPPNFDFKSET